MKLYLLITFCLLSGSGLVAQADTTTAPADSTPVKNTFTVGLVYCNNASYYGQKGLEKNPYAAVAASWRFTSGFYLTGLAYRLLNDSSAAVSAESLGAGYSFKMSKHLSADIGYSHTVYPTYSPFIQAANPDNATASLTYENWLSTRVNIDYAFGKTQDYFVTAGTGKQINLGSISPKDIITLTPELSVTAGTQRFYQTYVTELRKRDSVLGVPLPPLLGGSSSGSSGSSSAKTTSTTQFNLLSYTLKCPLAYNRSRYVVELAAQFSVLSNKVQNTAGKVNSFLTASFYYQF